MFENKLIYYLKKNILLKIGAFGGVTGCVFVAFGLPLEANMIWVLTNPFIAIHNYRIREYGQMILWSIYICIAVFGLIYNWGN
jgi:hypothetical protein